jgi:site-specific DNA recombinase
VNDVALGHTTKMRWNDASSWILSEDVIHPPVISEEIFRQAEARMADRRRGSTSRERIRTHHPYALSGRLLCGVCNRKMQSHWANELAYYRCRFPAEYALANKLSHPRNVFVRENQVLPRLDAWLSQEFAPHRLAQTIADLASAQDDDTTHQAAVAAARDRIRDCDAKMTRYRAAIDAGGDISEITAWINAAKAERVRAETALRTGTPPQRMTSEDIRALVAHFTQVGAVIVSAETVDKAEIYRSLNLVLTYQPAAQTVTAVAELAGTNHGVMGRVRGPTAPKSQCVLAGEFALGSRS